jgi:hypothetical protein
MLLVNRRPTIDITTIVIIVGIRAPKHRAVRSVLKRKEKQNPNN